MNPHLRYVATVILAGLLMSLAGLPWVLSLTRGWEAASGHGLLYLAAVGSLGIAGGVGAVAGDTPTTPAPGALVGSIAAVLAGMIAWTWVFGPGVGVEAQAPLWELGGEFTTEAQMVETLHHVYTNVGLAYGSGPWFFLGTAAALGALGGAFRPRSLPPLPTMAPLAMLLFISMSLVVPAVTVSLGAVGASLSSNPLPNGTGSASMTVASTLLPVASLWAWYLLCLFAAVVAISRLQRGVTQELQALGGPVITSQGVSGRYQTLSESYFFPTIIVVCLCGALASCWMVEAPVSSLLLFIIPGAVLAVILARRIAAASLIPPPPDTQAITLEQALAAALALVLMPFFLGAVGGIHQGLALALGVIQYLAAFEQPGPDVGLSIQSILSNITSVNGTLLVSSILYIGVGGATIAVMARIADRVRGAPGTPGDPPRTPATPPAQESGSPAPPETPESP